MTEYLFPSDNEWGVASLPLSADARIIPHPVIGWGTLGRGREMRGTWHYYVDDYRFRAVLRDPLRILASGCGAAVEPNISVFEQDPPWVALNAVGIKREIAAHWANQGLQIFVDLCVPARHRNTALLGVPKGWTSYATRGFSSRPRDLLAEYDMATRHSEGAPLLLVVGGGQQIEMVCSSLPGVVHVANSGGSGALISEGLANSEQKLHDGGNRG